MKKLVQLFAICVSALSLYSQTWDTVWTKTLGGSLDEVPGLTVLNNLGSPAAYMDLTDGGNFYFTTTTKSSNGYITTNKGEDDIWIAKLNANGDTLWTRVYGGSSIERSYKVLALNDGGCVVVGRTVSNDLDFTGSKGGIDAVLICLNADGTQRWLKRYGGSEDDYLYDVIYSEDGNLVACGESGSIDGDLAGTGQGLAWVLKVNVSNGNKIWSKTYLGPNSNSPDFLENFFRIVRLSDGSGYVACGYTTPTYTDPTKDDIYYEKISLTGNTIWSKKIGSTNGGEGVGAIVDAGNGEFYIAGKLAGGSGQDVSSGYYGGSGDVWLIKFAANGTKLWDKHYGGTNYDFAFDMKRDNNNNLFVAGFTRSLDYDATGQSYGMMDYWLLQLSANGDTIAKKRVGGSANDVAMCVMLADSNTVYLSGKTASNDLCVHGNFGGQDAWIVKLQKNTPVKLNELSSQNNAVLVYPNPAHDKIYINTAEALESISLINLQGKAIVSTNNSEIRLSDVAAGLYILHIKTKNNTYFRKINIE